MKSRVKVLIDTPKLLVLKLPIGVYVYVRDGKFVIERNGKTIFKHRGGNIKFECCENGGIQKTNELCYVVPFFELASNPLLPIPAGWYLARTRKTNARRYLGDAGSVDVAQQTVEKINKFYRLKCRKVIVAYRYGCVNVVLPADEKGNFGAMVYNQLVMAGY